MSINIRIYDVKRVGYWIHNPNISPEQINGFDSKYAFHFRFKQFTLMQCSFTIPFISCTLSFWVHLLQVLFFKFVYFLLSRCYFPLLSAIYITLPCPLNFFTFHCTFTCTRLLLFSRFLHFTFTPFFVLVLKSFLFYIKFLPFLMRDYHVTRRNPHSTDKYLFVWSLHLPNFTINKLARPVGRV